MLALVYIGSVSSQSGTFEALVSRVFGAYYDLLILPECTDARRGRLRGRLRIAGRKTEESWDHIPERHPILVGDRVACVQENDETLIESRGERKNALFRSSKFEQQGLGANLDRALVVMSLVFPDISQGFVDRFLASCHAGGVEPVILFTKVDLTDDGLREGCLELYRGLGYHAFAVNLMDPAGEDWESLCKLLSSGISLFAGRSGTGKSTLLNRLLGTENAAIGAVSESTRKGRHTTTNSAMVRDPKTGGLYVDTPGVKEWGVMNLDRRDIFESFPEFREAAESCKFRDCAHEPDTDGCAVLEKLAEPGQIHPGRILSLNSMLDSLGVGERIRRGDYVKATGRMRAGSKYALKNRPPENR